MTQPKQERNFVPAYLGFAMSRDCELFSFPIHAQESKKMTLETARLFSSPVGFEPFSIFLLI